MYYFERSECPPSAYHNKERGAAASNARHAFSKVKDLRAAVTAIVEDAKQRTARKENRAETIDASLSLLKTEKIRLGDLKRFVAGDTLLPKQLSDLRATFRTLEKSDALPACLTQPADNNPASESGLKTTEQAVEETKEEDDYVLLPTFDFVK